MRRITTKEAILEMLNRLYEDTKERMVGLNLLNYFTNGHLVKAARHYLVSNEIMIQNINHQYMWHKDKSAPTENMANAILVLYREEISRLSRNRNSTPHTENSALAAFSDKDLVSELRARGWEVSCEKQKVVKL